MRSRVSLILLLFLFLPSLALAQLTPGDTGLTDTGTQVYGPLTGDSQDIGTFFGERVLEPFFGVLGLVFMILILYGGIRWMTAGGNTAAVEKAKQILVRSILGLLIILLAYGFTQFIFDAIS